MSRPRRPAARSCRSTCWRCRTACAASGRAGPGPCRPCCRRRCRSSGPRAAGSATAVAPGRRGSAARCRWRRRSRWSCLRPTRSATPARAPCLAGRCAPPSSSCALLVPATAVAAGPPSATTGAAKSVTQSARDGHGHRRPAGDGDDLPLRVRDVVELRPADRRGRRGLGHRRGRRVGEPHRADDRHHLPLPRRGDQRGRGHARRGPHAARPTAAPGPPGATHRLGAQRHRGRRAARRRRSTPTAAPRPTTSSTARARATASAPPTPSAGSGQSARSVSASISGLTPNTRYHYRVVASNDAGVARGRDRSFVTLRNPQGITASASPNPAAWSGSTTVSGKVSGQGVGGATVALERQDFPFGGPFYLVGDQGGREQRLVLLQGRPAVGDGPPAPDHAHDDRRRQPDRRGPQRAARRPARAAHLRRARAPAGRGQPRGAQRPRHAAEALAQRALGSAAPRRRPSAGGGALALPFTVRRRGTYRVVVLPRDNFAHVHGASREVTLRR